MRPLTYQEFVNIINELINYEQVGQYDIVDWNLIFKAIEEY